MTDAERLVATVVILLVSAVITALIDRWARRQSLARLITDRLGPRDTPRPAQSDRIANIAPHIADDAQ